MFPLTRDCCRSRSNLRGEVGGSVGVLESCSSSSLSLWISPLSALTPLVLDTSPLALALPLFFFFGFLLFAALITLPDQQQAQDMY